MTTEQVVKAAADRAGFSRRWGVHVFQASRAPFLSLGVHVDWHTPTLDLHVGRTQVQIGRNNWQGEGRFSFRRHKSDGHTDQCLCWARK